MLLEKNLLYWVFPSFSPKNLMKKGIRIQANGFSTVYDQIYIQAIFNIVARLLKNFKIAHMDTDGIRSESPYASLVTGGKATLRFAIISYQRLKISKRLLCML